MKLLFGLLLITCVCFGFFILSKKNYEAKAHPIIHKKDSISVIVDKTISPFDDPNPLVERSLKEFEGFIKTAIVNRQAPGAAVAIVKDTNIIFLRGYGLRDAKKSDSVNTRTIFRLGSVSKSVTATLVAVLVNEGVLH